MSKAMTAIVTLVCFFMLSGAAVAQTAVYQKSECYAPTICDGSGCISVPTSLPPVDLSVVDENGWRTEEGIVG